MSDITQNLPAEVLAACLRFLDLRDLIAASHVSCFWRSSALAFPDLWSHISIDGSLWTSPDVLNTAISRAGQHPVDMDHFGEGALTDAMSEVIIEHLHRFRSLKWTYNLFGVNLIHPAPLLRSLSCRDLRFRITEDFLGGSPGALRTLSVGEAIFPHLCPALASVTHLHATFPGYSDADAGFQHLFDLCPRLETLHLHDLAGTAGGELPAGPAPRSLKEVMLWSGTGCNLIELYTAWRLESVQDVQLCMPIDVDAHLAPFFSDALDLSVALQGEDWVDGAVRIVAQLPGGRRRTFVSSDLDNVRDPGRLITQMLRAPQVRTLSIPLVLLGRGAMHQYWPLLAHLSIDIYESRMFDSGLPRPCESGQSFPWDDLQCLRSLPPLETLQLRVRGAHGSDPPTLYDARGLKACLSSLRDCIPREVHIHGFPMAVSREMSALADQEELRIVFH